jgi:hypothetical protein
MTALAEVAVVARMSGVDGHARARAQVFHAGSDGFDDPGEFVPENMGRFENGIADAAIGERVQIAAANTGGGDAQQDITGPGRAGMRHAFDAEVARAMEACGQHRTRG